jgi:hypothetical protein
MGMVRFELVTTLSLRLWYHVKEPSQPKSLSFLGKVPRYDLYYFLTWGYGKWREIIDTKAKVFVVSFFLIVIIDLRLFIWIKNMKYNWI